MSGIHLVDLKCSNIMPRLLMEELSPHTGRSCDDAALSAALRLSVEMIDMGDSYDVDPTKSPIFKYIQQCQPGDKFKKAGERDLDMRRGGTEEEMDPLHLRFEKILAYCWSELKQLDDIEAEFHELTHNKYTKAVALDSDSELDDETLDDGFDLEWPQIREELKHSEDEAKLKLFLRSIYIQRLGHCRQLTTLEVHYYLYKEVVAVSEALRVVSEILCPHCAGRWDGMDNEPCPVLTPLAQLQRFHMLPDLLFNSKKDERLECLFPECVRTHTWANLIEAFNNVPGARQVSDALAPTLLCQPKPAAEPTDLPLPSASSASSVSSASASVVTAAEAEAEAEARHGIDPLDPRLARIGRMREWVRDQFPLYMSAEVMSDIDDVDFLDLISAEYEVTFNATKPT